jgi:hypothetical protein
MACSSYQVINETNSPINIGYYNCEGVYISQTVYESAIICVDSNSFNDGLYPLLTFILIGDCENSQIPCSSQTININASKTDASAFGANDGSATISYSTDGNPNNEQGNLLVQWDSGSTGLTLNNLSAGTYFFNWTYSCSTSSKTGRSSVTINSPSQLLATATVSDVTSNGGNDGSIMLSVTGGVSGLHSFLWNDGATTQNRTGLTSGVYSVVVSDALSLEMITLQNIVVNEPGAPVIPVGSIFEVPFLNSIHFVANTGSNVQGLDNVSLCKQFFKGFDQITYFQKVEKSDNKIVQFNSDFESHIFELRNLETDALIKSFAPTLVEQNIGVAEDYTISIRNHTQAGKSRVYFTVGDPPIPLTLNNFFEISNTTLYNGTYSIVGIERDTLLGYDYIIINKTFLDGTSIIIGNGKFYNDLTEFNVYEFSINFIDVSDGFYYLRGIATSSNERIIVSEPIDVKLKHEGTNLITYRNEDNAFDITWTSGYIGTVRVESLFGHKRTIGGDQSITRDSSYSLVKVSAKAQRILLFETFMLPMYMHEKLGLIFRCDSVNINNVTVQAEEGYAEPKYVERFLLANSSIKVEQTGWLNRYNSNDTGGTVAEGFILANEGFIKR